MSISPQVEAGQAIYTRTVLRMYDVVVHGVSNHFIWRCPTRKLIDSYDQHATGDHLELGVGTGLLLDRSDMGSPTRLVLVDLNENCLKAAARRVARHSPRTYRRNVLEPFELSAERPFQSIAMHYLLHCLPGNLPTKAAVLDHARDYLAPEGVLFGSTLLADGVERSATARALMRAYNRRRIFDNAGDSLSDLRHALARRFARSHVEVVGCAAIFWGKKSPP